MVIMKKVKFVLFSGVLLIVGAIGGICSANLFRINVSGTETEYGHTLEEKMMHWMVNNVDLESQVKSTEIEIPVSLFPEDYDNEYCDLKGKDKKISVTAVDLDDDNHVEYMVYSGSGNRNSTYDIFKMYDGKLRHCGSTGGVNVAVIKHNSYTGIFSKWALGAASASYSFHRLVNGRMEEIISFAVDGSEASTPHKNDKITITLQTSNNFMKKQCK